MQISVRHEVSTLQETADFSDEGLHWGALFEWYNHFLVHNRFDAEPM